MSSNKSILDGTDPNLPSLNLALEMQKRAADVGFDWPSIEGVIAKIYEEIDEVLLEVSQANKPERLQDEIGDLLFACTNLARHLNIDPEQALQNGNNKFYRRFSKLEHLIHLENQTVSQCTLEQLDTLWNKVKRLEK